MVGNSIAYTGAFKAALQEAASLSDQYEYLFCMPSGSILTNELERLGYKTYTLPMLEIGRSFKKIFLYFPRLVANAFRLKDILRKENIDLIHINDFYNLIGSAAKMLGYKGKLITHVRFLPSSRPFYLRKCWSFIAQLYSDRVICVSDAVLSEMRDQKNTVRIYNSISFEEKIQNEVEKNARPDDPVGRENEISILYLSNYIPGKGLNYALEAFALAYKEQTDLRLNFFGGDMGLRKNERYKAQLLQRAKELGIDNVVQFGEFVTEPERIIKEADIVLNFSEAESFSMTCAEASYYGRPVIATRCGGPEEIIEHNYSGLLVENRNVQEMKEAILRLSRNKYIREEMGKAGRKIVREKFTESLFKNEFSKLLGEVLA